MEDIIQTHIEEVQKVNLRVKEFLWKEKNFRGIESYKWKNVRSRLLAR